MTVWELVVVVVLLALLALCVWGTKWAVKQVSLALKSKKVGAKLVGAVLLLPFLFFTWYSILLGILSW
jgi:NADH:ubiquinone oxidoreductase subunit 6 (subunit J)